MPLNIHSVSANSGAASIDVDLRGAGAGARVQIERRIPTAHRAAAIALGVPSSEANKVYEMTSRHPLASGSGVWQDFQVRSGVEYSYRARDISFATWTHTTSEAWAGA